MEHESDAEVLDYDECLRLLASEAIGRIAVIAEPYPLVFPINYRLVDGHATSGTPGHTWIAIRTRPGNPIDRAPMFVSFEVDRFDRDHRTGWSVLVTGTMHRIDRAAADFGAQFDPDPWIAEQRDRWLVVHPAQVTGRRLRGSDGDWAFPSEAYL